jgi:hypothetical protein
MQHQTFFNHFNQSSERVTPLQFSLYPLLAII